MHDRDIEKCGCHGATCRMRTGAGRAGKRTAGRSKTVLIKVKCNLIALYVYFGKYKGDPPAYLFQWKKF